MGLLVADTYLVDTAVLMATILVLLYFWSTSTFKYWEKRGVRTVKKVTPLLGSLEDPLMQRRQLGLHFQDMYQELEGEPYGGYYKLRQPALLLRDPALIKLVLLKDFTSFLDNDIHASEKTDPMFAFNLFGMKGARWKYARTRISPVFSTAKIRNMFPFMLDVCADLKESIQAKIDSGDSHFEANNLAIRFTTDVVGSCAYALKVNSLRDENNRFRVISHEILALSHLGGFCRMMWFLYAGNGDYPGFCGLKFLPDHIVDFFRGIVREAMDYREKNDLKRNDLIQYLMHLKQQQQQGAEQLDEGEEENADKTDTGGEATPAPADSGKFEFTHDVLTAQAVAIYFNGVESSSVPLGFAIHELAMNPAVQTRLRAELRALLAASGATSGSLGHDDVRDCAYLDQIILETLRKYPVTGVLNKTCTQRYQIPGTNVKLEVGTPVSIPVHAIHHDPQYYPDPENFDPDRFNEANKSKRVPYTYLPFGEGPRQCIGMRFALAQVKAALATIVLNFEIRPSAKTQHPVRLDPRFFMVTTTHGLHVQALPLPPPPPN